MSSELEILYHNLCRTPSDINLHLPTLMQLVDNFTDDAFAERARVTEFGTRHGWSTVALLMGWPRWLKTYDIEPKPEDQRIIRQAWYDHIDWCEDDNLVGSSGLQFIHGNTLEVEIEETDILFIDTLHTGAQLSRELERHHKKVSTYIAMHDLTSYGLTDEAPVSGAMRGYHPGLVPAVFDFMQDHKEWEVDFYTPVCNGLLILKRREKMQNCYYPCPDCGRKIHYVGLWPDEPEEI